MFRYFKSLILLSIVINSSVFSQATTFGVIDDLLGTGVLNNTTPGMRCVEGKDVYTTLKSPILSSKVAYEPNAGYLYLRFQLITSYQEFEEATLKPFIRKDANGRSDLIAIRCGLKYISRQYIGNSFTLGYKLSPKEGTSASEFKYDVADLLEAIKTSVEGNRWGEYTTKEKVSEHLQKILGEFKYWINRADIESWGYHRGTGGPAELAVAINSANGDKEALNVFTDFAWKKMSGKNDEKIKDGVWLETELTSILDLI